MFVATLVRYHSRQIVCRTHTSVRLVVGGGGQRAEGGDVDQRRSDRASSDLTRVATNTSRANIRQSELESGPLFQMKVPDTFEVDPFSLDSGMGHATSNQN